MAEPIMKAQTPGLAGEPAPAQPPAQPPTEPGSGPDASALGAAEPILRICARCRHQRMRPEPELFSAGDLQTAAILKSQVEWDQQRRQRAQQETQRVAAGLPFEYEPHHFAWCAAFTPLDLAQRASKGDAAALSELMATGAGVINPVSGEVSPIYALCVQKNPAADCPRYEPK